MLFERGTFGRHGTEHKAAVTRYARYFSKADTGFRNAFVAIGQRIAHQVAGIRESPGMVGADKRFAIAFLIGAKLIAPVRTLVQKKPDIPFPIADPDDGRGAHAFGHVEIGRERGRENVWQSG